MRSPSQTPTSTRILGKLLEPAVSVEVRTLPVRRESKRMRECRERKFPSDRKVVRRCNHSVAIAARARRHARGDHPIDRTRLILLDKLWRRLERARFFVGRNKTCT